MISPPTQPYSGLTVVLDKPSRFDGLGLLSGHAGAQFESMLLADAKYGVHRGNIEVRTLDECPVKPFREGTKQLLILGEDSLKRFNSGVSLGEQRGSPFVYDSIPCVATYAPQDAYDRKAYFSDDGEEGDDAGEGDSKSTHGKTRRKNWKFWMRQDVRKAVRLCKEGLHNEDTTEYHLFPDAEQVIRLLTDTKLGTFYFDIETDPCFQMTCFGFSFGDGHVYVVPMLQTYFTPRKYYYDTLTTAKILRALAVAFRDNTTIIHNSMFDLFVCCWRYGIPFEGRVYDTMLSHSRCYIEVEKSLGHAISLYTDAPYHKNEGIFEPHNSAQTEQLYRYNGKDISAMVQLKKQIDARAAHLGATESVEQVNRLVVPYLLATLQGMRVDTEAVKTLVTKNDRMEFQLVRMLQMITGREDFNPGSWQQVAWHLYDQLGIPKPSKDITAEATLLEILLKRDVPAIHLILEYRSLGKQSSKVSFWPWRNQLGCAGYTPEGALSTDYKGDDRFTCSWMLAGTTTMRLGSRKLMGRKSKKKGTYLGGWGDNFQNFAYKLREVIAPDLGKVLVQGDESGADALIVAYLCKPGKFRDLFLHGVKPHIYVALHVFAEQWSKMPDKVDNATLIRALVAEPKDLKNVEGWARLSAVIEDSDKWDSARRYYFVGKKTCHSANYGMGPKLFRTVLLQESGGTIVKSIQECEKILETYHNLFPEIRQWHQDVVAQVKRTSILRNLFGHPRVFTGHHDESAYREWYSFIPQSTVGQIANYAFAEIVEELQKGMHPADIDMLQNNHDSIMGQCLPENKEYLGRLIASKINRALVSPRGEKFQMKSGIQWSDKSWGTMIPIEFATRELYEEYKRQQKK